MNDPANKETDATLAKKLIGAGLVLLAAYMIFMMIVRGTFAAIMRGGSENAVYVFFYGGLVVLIALAGIGILAATLIPVAKDRTPAPAQSPEKPIPPNPPSALRRGVVLGLVTVVAAVAMYFALFFWAVSTAR